MAAVSLPLLESVCGSGGALPAGDLRFDGPHPALAAAPADEAQAAALLRLAAERGWALVPRGGGSCDRLGNPLRQADLVLSTARLNRIVEYEPADLTVTVEPGLRMDDLQQRLAARGQRLPLDAPAGATAGGVVAAAVAGPLRYAYGGPRELVLGMRVALTSGEVIQCGARVVKNVAGYDLNKLFTGSMGTLGLLTQVTFKVFPRPSVWERLLFAAPLEAARAVVESELEVESLDWFGPQGILAVTVAGEQESVAYHRERLRGILGEPAPGEPPLFSPARTVLKALLPPAALGRLLDEASALFPGAPAAVSLAGVARLAVDDPSVVGLIDRIGRLDGAARHLGGHLVVEEAPAPVKAAVDVWGQPGPGFALMRQLKQRFDPAGILNPGRFVGGL